MKRNIDAKATAALAGAILCWSTVPLFLKAFTPYIDAWTANGIRYPFAALLYLPWLVTNWRKGRIRAKMWRLALVPSLINICGQVLWAWTPYYLAPGLMAFLVRLSTLWAVLGSFILFHEERLLLKSALFQLGFLFVAGGFIVMSTTGERSYSEVTAIGVVLVFLTSIGWAGYQVSVRRNMTYIDSRTAFGMIAAITATGLVVSMFTFGQPQRALLLSTRMSLMVLLSGAVGIAGAHLLFYIALKRIGLAIATSANIVSAVVTALFSRILFDEDLSPIQWIGGVALVGGGILLTLAQNYIKKGVREDRENRADQFD